MQLSDQPSRTCAPWWSRLHLAELAVVFAIGVAQMQFFYSVTPDPDRALPISVPGNDSFYHIKMAALLPEIGLPDTLPWLTQTIFADRFVSHHYGFHAYLAPFVHVSHWLTGDYLPGARWAMSVSFGLVLAVCVLVLMSERVRWRWLWLALLLMLPTQFYSRHAYVRAIDLSLLCLLVGCFFLFRRRYLLAGLTVLIYTHVYLASFFAIIVGGIHLVSLLLDPTERGRAWKLAFWLAVGGIAGFVTHPYFPENIAFLKTQIFDSGLTPEIDVGREWKPYSGVWWFANLIGVPMVALTCAMVLRLRTGGKLTVNQWTMLVANFFFFALMLKAKRFIEYWPILAVLSAAMLAGPVLPVWEKLRLRTRRVSDLRPPGAACEESSGQRPGANSSPGDLWQLVAVSVAAIGLAIVMYIMRERLKELLAWWPVWTILIAAYAGVVLIRCHHARCARVTAATCGVATLALALVILLTGGPVHQIVRKNAKGKFHLQDVEAAMAFLIETSEPDDIVFTDDWDIFPVFFYYNHHNRFVYGLDPVFGLHHDAELWQRFVKISRGLTPCKAVVKEHADGQTDEREIDVRLTDIRDRFGADWVVVDKDHQPFARRLDWSPDLAQRVYPPETEQNAPAPPYTIYRILDGP